VDGVQRSSVRFGLLALFADGPKYGYQLRTEFDSRTGGTWAINVGQVYTTLERLERDGLVAADGTNVDGRAVYRITDEGHEQLARWFATPVSDADRPRSELSIKLATAAVTPGVDVATVIQTQRNESMRQMRDYTALRRQADPDADLAWLLLLESLIFAIESEIRWLDHVEATVLRRRPLAGSARRPGSGQPPTTSSAAPAAAAADAQPDTAPTADASGAPR
jgi:DNA-binding PadR family transcriptional regulator